MKPELLKLEKLPLEEIAAIPLTVGSHDDRADGLCVMEAVAWFAGEKQTDQPQCVCPSLREFLINWNDQLPSDEDRARLLKPLIPLIIGTNQGADLDRRRRLEIWKWQITEALPAWLEVAGLNDDATALRADPSPDNIHRAAKNAAAAGDAARTAAGYAVWTAAWDAAGDAARTAAWAGARTASLAASGDAANAAVWYAAKAAAWDAAGAAAWDAVWAGAGDAARTAVWTAVWDAARTAAWDRLAPTVAKLQDSAVELIKRLALMK